MERDEYHNISGKKQIHSGKGKATREKSMDRAEILHKKQDTFRGNNKEVKDVTLNVKRLKYFCHCAGRANKKVKQEHESDNYYGMEYEGHNLADIINDGGYDNVMDIFSSSEESLAVERLAVERPAVERKQRKEGLKHPSFLKRKQFRNNR